MTKDKRTKSALERDSSIEEILRYADEEILKRAKTGDSKSQFAMVGLLLSESLLRLDERLLDEAEIWLYEAEKNGSLPAKNMLSSGLWLAKRESQQKKIRDRKGASEA